MRDVQNGELCWHSEFQLHLLAFPFFFSFRAMSLLRNAAQSNQAKLVICRDVHAR